MLDAVLASAVGAVDAIYLNAHEQNLPEAPETSAQAAKRKTTKVNSDRLMVISIFSWFYRITTIINILI